MKKYWLIGGGLAVLAIVGWLFPDGCRIVPQKEKSLNKTIKWSYLDQEWEIVFTCEQAEYETCVKKMGFYNKGSDAALSQLIEKFRSIKATAEGSGLKHWRWRDFVYAFVQAVPKNQRATKIMTFNACVIICDGYNDREEQRQLGLHLLSKLNESANEMVYFKSYFE